MQQLNPIEISFLLTGEIMDVRKKVSDPLPERIKALLPQKSLD